ncbi:MAG: NAD-dependent epimerase/dehydratase family protein [Verrucomicrobia bacterium]|nr:NAD-dependent epimerase/dehydratase family protein [Verrucomicrobiota bacterium]
MKKVIITGISGVLGQALAKKYKSLGWEVIGVTRRDNYTHPNVDRILVCQQCSLEDAGVILAEKPTCFS